MAPFPSITTTLYAAESLSLLTGVSMTLSSIPLTRITNKDSTRHIPLFPGEPVSGMSSPLSCRKYIHPPSWLLRYSSDYPEYASFGGQGIQKGLLPSL